MPKKQQYKFYCVMCGTPFTPSRPDARTCSSECRVALCNAGKNGIYEVPAPERSEIDKEETQKRFKVATGREIPKAIIDQHPSKPKKEEPQTATGKLLGKKKAAEAPAEDEQEAEGEEEPATAKTKKK